MKILIIEDYSDIATIYSFMLESNGHTVQVAKNGKEGLEKTLEFKPEIIMLDIMLPDIDGLEVLKTIRTDEKYTSIKPHILMTSNLLQDNTSKRAKALGADGYVVKANMQNQDLVNIIQELSDRIKSGETKEPVTAESPDPSLPPQTT